MSEANKLNRKELLALWEKAFDAYEMAEESTAEKVWILYELRTTNEPNLKEIT